MKRRNNCKSGDVINRAAIILFGIFFIKTPPHKSLQHDGDRTTPQKKVSRGRQSSRGMSRFLSTASCFS
ncbi:unnamed protein product [Urochloa humidicola]